MHLGYSVSYIGLPSLADYRNGITGPTSSQQPISTDHVYPFIAEAESTYGALLQDALVSRIAVDAGGVLAPDATTVSERVEDGMV